MLSVGPYFHRSVSLQVRGSGGFPPASPPSLHKVPPAQQGSLLLRGCGWDGVGARWWGTRDSSRFLAGS